MNLILLSPADFTAPDTARLTGRRLRHALEVLKPGMGDLLTVGLEGGQIGSGRVIAIDALALELQVALSAAPPSRIPLVLCLALMRPLVFKRVLLTAASLGVEEIVLFHVSKVEKSFWQSTSLGEAAVREQLVLGVEQSRDTVLPPVSFQKKFKPFVEEVLPALLRGRSGVVADPSGRGLRAGGQGGFQADDGPRVLILGPEGGFIPYEIGRFQDAGCDIVSLGPRILKVETAMVALVSFFLFDARARQISGKT